MAERIDADSLGFLLTDASRLMRTELDRRIAEAGIGLTPGECRALVHAARAGAVRQSVLAERMGVEAMTLSAYLDRLEGQGLVERRPDPADRRAKIVYLTPAAGPVIDSIAPIAVAVRGDATMGMSADDRDRLLALLKVVRGNLCRPRADGARGEKSVA